MCHYLTGSRLDLLKSIAKYANDEALASLDEGFQRNKRYPHIASKAKIQKNAIRYLYLSRTSLLEKDSKNYKRGHKHPKAC